MIKSGSIAKMRNSQGEDFTVRVLKTFDYDGIEYAEVEPVEFEGFAREVPQSRLREIDIEPNSVKQEEKMLEMLEYGRQMSEYNAGHVYAFGNGKDIKLVVSSGSYKNLLDSRDKLVNEGYWVVSIFKDGHRCEA